MTVALVTGAHGFIGAHLVRYLAEQGEVVLGIGHGNWPEHRDAGVTCWINGEIDSVNLNAVTADVGKPDVIYHLAGGSSVRPSFQAPLEDFRRTVDTTARVLDWIRDQSPNSRIVFVSSAAIYGSGCEGLIAEEVPATPMSPYGIHKAMAESLCASYANHFGVQATIVRLFSVYGPGLRKQLLWDVCARILKHEHPLTLGGTGVETRDWLHVRDAVRLLAIAGANASIACPVFNGGTGIGTTVAEVVTSITKKWSAPAPLFSNVRRLGDPVSLVANIERIRHRGFEPTVHLDQGLSETMEWIRRESTGKP